MKTTFSLSILYAMVVTATIANAETLSFAEVWQKVVESSSAQEGSRLKTQAAEAGLSRAERHWLPRVYLNAQSYQTNDPGNSFFGLLEQRKVGSSDFSPDSLNHPDAQILTRGALGVDLALYEGGMKQTQVEMYNHIAAAERLGASQVAIEQYVQSGLAYGSIAAIRKQRAKLEQLNDELSKLIKNYQLGQKSNPVGYSGLLGMKSLANRVAGLIDQLGAQEKASFSALREMGVKESNWEPQSLDARAFIDRYLNLQARSDSNSYKTLAGGEAVQALSQASCMERSRYLPRIGAFAESYVFNGSRDTANGYTGGLYLQWSLFDPSDFGKYQEAKLAAMAKEKFNQAEAQQESAERAGLKEAESAMRANLARLDDSDHLLTEQNHVSSTLFRNGSINALQFVEILNRRTDLIAQQSEAEIALLKTSAEKAKRTRFDIADIMNAGGKK